MSERDMELLVPFRILGVGDDARARHRGAGEADGDVRVARDDLAVAVLALLGPAAGHVESGEAAAEALGDHVHVR